MTKPCVVPNCRTGYRSNKSKHSVFRVPRDKERLKKWENAIPGEIKLKESHVVCDKHFQDNYILRHWIHRDSTGKIIAKAPYMHPKLSELAVPTIFTDDESKKALSESSTALDPLWEKTTLETPSLEQSDSTFVDKFPGVKGTNVDVKTDKQSVSISEPPISKGSPKMTETSDDRSANSIKIVDVSSVNSIKIVDVPSINSIKVLDERSANSIKIVDVRSANTTKILDDRSADSIKIMDAESVNCTEILDERSGNMIKILLDPSEISMETLDDRSAKSTEILKDQSAKTTEILKNRSAKTTEILKDRSAKSTELLEGQSAKTTEILEDQSTKTTEILVERLDVAMEIADDEAAVGLTNTVPEVLIAKPILPITKPFEVFSKVANRRLTKEEAEESSKLPDCWSVTDLRRETSQLLVFSYLVTKLENEVQYPVTQKSVTIDVEKKIEYFVYGRRLTAPDPRLERVLHRIELLPIILRKFQWINICLGLGDVQTNDVPNDTAYLDQAQQWRDNKCSMLGKRKRCVNCLRLRKRIAQTIKRNKNAAGFSRIRSLTSPSDKLKIQEIRNESRMEKRKCMRAQMRVQSLMETIKEKDDVITEIAKKYYECKQIVNGIRK